MKERAITFNSAEIRAILSGKKTQHRRIKEIKESLFSFPFGVKGDRLWVRETWQGPILENENQYEEENGVWSPKFCVYRATDKLDAVDADGRELGWRSSTSMPRWASRITLEITEVRIEKLHEMTDSCAWDEGVDERDVLAMGCTAGAAVGAYSVLFEKRHGEGSWESNPWVFVIEFKKL